MFAYGIVTFCTPSDGSERRRTKNISLFNRFSLIIYLDKYMDVLSERILKIYCRRFDMKLKKTD